MDRSWRDWSTDREEGEAESDPAPDMSNSRYCQNCGNHVTADFLRVFGSNRDVVYGCPNCTTSRERSNRVAASGERKNV